jgi:hypothetical protein
MAKIIRSVIISGENAKMACERSESAANKANGDIEMASMA